MIASGRFGAGFLLALSVMTVVQASPLQQIADQLDPAPVIRGSFVQEKALAGFGDLLRSNGRFVFSREQGVVWQVEAPFPSTIVITAEGLYERDEGGQWQYTDSDAQPALALIHTLTTALMSADLQRLQAHFDLHAEQSLQTGWRMLLRPKPGPLAEVLARVQLRGAQLVQGLVMEELGGDRTEIELQGQAVRDLSADEQALFARRPPAS